MKSKLAELLIASSIMGGLSTPIGGAINRKTTEPNGNSRRKHKENVKRKKLRRISKISKQINRKAA